jgi:uncharacterized protein (DUF488 family)
MIFTIGHSNHASERFLNLLAGVQITAVADVRSVPHSRWAPQYNKDTLAKALGDAQIAYVYLGRELGGRPGDPRLLQNGKPNYDAMARTQAFRDGIARILEGSKTHRIALMCAERDPLDCHRFHLIARHLDENNLPVSHILTNGAVERHQDTEDRWRAKQRSSDFFDFEASGVRGRAKFEE